MRSVHAARRHERRALVGASTCCIVCTRLRSRALLHAQESSAAFSKGHSRACHFGGVFSSSVDKQIRVQCRTSGLRVPAWIRTSVMQHAAHASLLSEQQVGASKSSKITCDSDARSKKSPASDSEVRSCTPHCVRELSADVGKVWGVGQVCWPASLEAASFARSRQLRSKPALHGGPRHLPLPPPSRPSPATAPTSTMAAVCVFISAASSHPAAIGA